MSSATIIKLWSGWWTEHCNNLIYFFSHSFSIISCCGWNYFLVVKPFWIKLHDSCQRTLSFNYFYIILLYFKLFRGSFHKSQVYKFRISAVNWVWSSLQLVNTCNQLITCQATLSQGDSFKPAVNHLGWMHVHNLLTRPTGCSIAGTKEENLS